MYKAILIALNATLISNYQAANPRMPDAEDWMRNGEKYNSWLIEWLRKVDSQVYIVTVRRARYEEATLDGITRKTSWKPDRAYFNDTGKKGGCAKSILLDRVLRDTGLQPCDLYAFEGNTRDILRMYENRGVQRKIVTRRSHLPLDVGPFMEAGGWPQG